MDQKKSAEAGFETLSAEQWKELIVKDLKGKAYEKLVWQSLDGIDVQPFYSRESRAGSNPLAFAGIRSGWTIRQDYRATGQKAGDMAELSLMAEGGVEELDLCTVQSSSVAELLRYASQNFKRVNICTAGPRLFALLPGATGMPNIVIQLDPISPLMRGEAEADSYFDLAASIINNSDNSSYCMISDGEFFHNCGATPVQELALSLATAAEYMHEMTERGIEAKEAFSRIRLQLAAGTDYFMEMAKFRAARLLWQDLAQSYGLDAQAHPAEIAANTSVYHYSVYDMYTNQLRATTGAMSAILGGASSLMCTPLDSPAATPRGFTRRIARNIQHLLREEAHLHQVADPAGGTYYVEELTRHLHQKALELFKEIENKGGLLSCYKDGLISDMISQSNAKRFRQLCKGKANMLGVNIFPNTKEKSKQTKKEGETNGAFKPNVLRPYRMAEVFEEIRMQTEQRAETPAVFLLPYGNPAWRTARTSFAKNFLGVGGFGIIDNPAFASAIEGAKKAAASGAKFVVVCSSDEEYPESISEIKEHLGQDQYLIVAGNPGENKVAWEKLGADDFIHMKSNMIITLSNLQEIAGIR